MDQKITTSRHWKRKSSNCTEKTIIVSNETVIPPPQQLPSRTTMNLMMEDEQQLGRIIICNDNSVDRNSPLIEEAIISAREKKAESEVAYLKQELDRALHRGVAAEERLAHLDTALRECMQQINALQDEPEREDKERLELDLREANEKLRATASENTRLKKALVCKDELVRELEQEKFYLESEFDALMVRAEMTEKERTLLRHECCSLETELASLTEERAYNTEYVTGYSGVPKATELEAECQKLRLLLQNNNNKAKQGHVKDRAVPTSRRTRRLNNGGNGPHLITARDQQQLLQNHENTCCGGRKRIDFLADRLLDVEEENRALRDVVAAKDKELNSSKLKCAQTAYRLALVQSELKDVREDKKAQQRDQFCLDASKSDFIADSESRATVLVSELDPSQKVNAKDQADCKGCGASKPSLMDRIIKDRYIESSENHQFSKQIIPTLQQGQVKCSRKGDGSTVKRGSWPWDALRFILEEHLFSKRGIGELMEDIRSALAESCPDLSASEATWTSSTNPARQDICNLQWGESNLNTSICRIIELLEGISPVSLVGSLEPNADYSVHVFRWRNSELIAILQRFVLACSCLLSVGKFGVESFAQELKTALEWTVDKCITLQDASQVREKIRKHFCLDRSKSESELGITTTPSSGTENHHNVLTQMFKSQSNLQKVNWGLSRELEAMDSANGELERQLQSAKADNEGLMNQLQELRHSVVSLQRELKELRESKVLLDEQMENLKTVNEDLETQLTVARGKVNEILQKISSLEVELEDKNNCCQELEAVCLELQLQLEIVSRKGSPDPEDNQSEGEKLIKGWELIASEKISEHEKTIRAVESLSEEAMTDDDLDHATNNKNKLPQRLHFSLRDRMLAEEDNAQTKEMIVRMVDVEKKPTVESYTDCNGTSLETKRCPTMEEEDTSKTGALILVPGTTKKPRGGFGVIRKLFFRRRKWTGKNNTTILLRRNSSRLMH